MVLTSSLICGQAPPPSPAEVSCGHRQCGLGGVVSGKHNKLFDQCAAASKAAAGVSPQGCCECLCGLCLKERADTPVTSCLWPGIFFL